MKLNGIHSRIHVSLLKKMWGWQEENKNFVGGNILQEILHDLWEHTERVKRKCTLKKLCLQISILLNKTTNTSIEIKW